MPVHITNISRTLVSVELNSGSTLHLAPGERSAAIEPFEIGDNPWIRTLGEQGRVALDTTGEEPARGRRRDRKDSGKADTDSPRADD
ncbi:hypothetical protein ACIBQ1_24165 [Nonomuraea sp. NPDC050153]|uniref:hypothetical protein n=1 Tax=Nonomuraea sp. NPDC050153 TaxID=3364359 RepID=UPI0037A9653D